MISKKIVALAAATVIGLVTIPASAKISAETGLKHSAKSAKVTTVSHKRSKHHKHHHRRTAKKTVASSKTHKSAAHKVA